MPAQRGTHALAAAWQGGSLGILSILDERTLVEVLRAAKAARALALLASSSRQLCTLARSRVLFTVKVDRPGEAQLALWSHARGSPPFSGCTRLEVAAQDTAACLQAMGVLGVAQHWPALRELYLSVDMPSGELSAGYTVDMCVLPLLGALQALQQLRALTLQIPDAGPCSGEVIGHLVQLTSLRLQGSGDAGADVADTELGMASLSRLTNLRELYMESVLGVEPAAGSAGPFCLPSSLTAVTWWYNYNPRELACLLTHLPGCPQLQQLDIRYGPLQDICAHPAAVVRLLGQHNRQLRQLVFEHDGGETENWGAAVPALPGAAAGQQDVDWRPDAALVALTGLEELDGSGLLTVKAGAGWQHLAQLTALTKLGQAVFHRAPPVQAGATLAVLELDHCSVHLGGTDLGRLLLACPHLETAVVITTPLAAAPVDASQPQLKPHPRLKALVIRQCEEWGSAALAALQELPPPPPPPAAAAAAALPPPPPAPVTHAAAAAAHFAGLAPVLRGVSELHLGGWPAGSSSTNSSSSSSSSSSGTRGILPDLSPCTALTKLVFDVYTSAQDLVPMEQEEYLSMLAPLQQLRMLRLQFAKRVNARIVLVLQLTLPQLRRVELSCCGSQLPLLPEGSEQQQHQQALERVKQLLRPGLVLVA